MNSFRQIIWDFFTLIKKGIFAFTLQGFAVVPHGVWRFDEEEGDEEKEEASGICVNCGKYDCEC